MNTPIKIIAAVFLGLLLAVLLSIRGAALTYFVYPFGNALPSMTLGLIGFLLFPYTVIVLPLFTFYFSFRAVSDEAPFAWALRRWWILLVGLLTRFVLWSCIFVSGAYMWT